jgi:hypothetical protein
LMDWFVRARARGRMGPNERACTCAFMAGENGEHGVGGGSRGFMLAAYKGMCYDDVWFSKGPPPVPISTPRHPRKLDTKRLRYMCPWFTPGIERGAPLVRSPCCRSTCRPCTIHHRTPCRQPGLATRRFWWVPAAVAMCPGRSAFTARGAHMFAGMLVACCQCDHPPAVPSTVVDPAMMSAWQFGCKVPATPHPPPPPPRPAHHPAHHPAPCRCKWLASTCSRTPCFRSAAPRCSGQGPPAWRRLRCPSHSCPPSTPWS